MDNNLFDSVNQGSSKAIEAVKKKVSDYLPYILLILVIVLRCVLEIYTPGYNNPFTLVFFLDTTVSIAMTLLVYMIFIPQGTSKEKLSNLSYKENCTEWSKQTKKIRDEHRQGEFREYCVSQVEVERRERRMEIIGNNTTLTYEEYEAKYASMSREDLKIEYESGRLTKCEYRAILRANGNIKVKPINANLILLGVEKQSYNDAGRSKSNYLLRWMAKRPLLTLGFAIIVNMLSGGVVHFSLAMFYGMIMDTLSLIVAAFVGYGAGEQSIRERNDSIKGKILFIYGFFETNNK